MTRLRQNNCRDIRIRPSPKPVKELRCKSRQRGGATNTILAFNRIWHLRISQKSLSLSAATPTRHPAPKNHTNPNYPRLSSSLRRSQEEDHLERGSIPGRSREQTKLLLEPLVARFFFRSHFQPDRPLFLAPEKKVPWGWGAKSGVGGRECRPTRTHTIAAPGPRRGGRGHVTRTE